MLNLNKEGAPFAKIIGGAHNNQIVSVSAKATDDKGFRYLDIAKDCKFQLTPNPEAERQTSGTS